MCVSAMDKCILLTRLIVFLYTLSKCCDGIQLSSTFSVSDLRGTAVLSQPDADANVNVQLTVSTPQMKANGSYTLHITQLPVDYTQTTYCSRSKLGKILYRLDDIGKLEFPTTNGTINVETDRISLLGRESVLGRALVLRGRRHTACFNIHADEQSVPELLEYTVHEARFLSPVVGSVYFRTYLLNSTRYTTVMADLQHTSISGSTVDSEHGWAVLITDVLDTAADEARGTCNFLQLVYDPTGSDTREDTVCSPESPDACKAGDLTGRLGHVRVLSRPSRSSSQFWNSTDLQLPPRLSVGRRSAYLVLYDERHEDAILACAKLVQRDSRVAEATLSQHGVAGRLQMSQRSRFEPTIVSLNMSGLDSRARHFSVHELPVAPPSAANGQRTCHRLGPVYNPHGVDESKLAAAGGATHDQFPAGDLSGKHGELTGLDQFAAAVVDHNLALLGAGSVIGRSIVFELNANTSENNTGSERVCATLFPVGRQVRAIAVFRFPVGGVVHLSQPEDDPSADTTVHVQGLLHTDGAVNASDWLRWNINDHVPGADFMNWTARCVSAGDVFNPHKVNAKSRYYYSSCTKENMIKCQLGDLTPRLGSLSIQADRKYLDRSYRLWTDSNLPLSGPHSVIGRSMVIHDDNGPRVRGDRLACVQIMRDYRYKAVVKNWAYNTEPRGISGKLEFIQESPFSATSTELDLAGLQGIASGFHVHLVPVVRHESFPCHNVVVGGHYNPLNFDSAFSPPPGVGTQDQYEVGDLSGKFGPLDGADYAEQVYNDSSLQLFGSNTILGRSIVIHKANDGSRWACGTVGWGYSSSEARQVTAVASFHHPKGYAWGYIRFSQLIYLTGGRSETIVELNLRYPGVNNRNITRGHNWAVFVNPVGHDAAVPYFNARCTAGGFRWNPDFIHLANPNAHDFYREQCSPETPLRCEVGDLGGRLGPINLGLDRVVLSDPNLPLDGDFWHNAVGKSVIIHEKDGGHRRMACANIELDYDIVKRVSIRRQNNFVSSKFIKDVRDVMQAPEWFVFIDEQETSTINVGRCVQFTVHFRGPLAKRLQLDFTRLFAAGRLESPSVVIPGFHNPTRPQKVGYKLCGPDPQDRRRFRGSSSGYYLNGADSSNMNDGRMIATFTGLTILLHISGCLLM